MPISRLTRFALFTSGLALFIPFAKTDPVDWVNIEYVTHQGTSHTSQSRTSDAQRAIIVGAEFTAQRGPWSVTNAKGVLPPSQNPHDYLSWAPYHWPDCHWCAHGTVHLVHGPNGTEGTRDDSDTSPDGPDPYSGGDSDTSQYAQAVMDVGDDSGIPAGGPTTIPVHPTASQVPNTSGTQTSDRVLNGTPAPAQAPAKTKTSSCTPSPTSMAPSATWTTCPYVVQDGRVNPDVRTLNGPTAINAVSQSVLYNSIAYALEGTAVYARNMANFLTTFFLATGTKMNPNMDYGQVVRGPGKAGQIGSFTGVLDLRGMTKIANAVMVMRATKSADWKAEVDAGMEDWMSKYAVWMRESDIGQKAASRPNNHGSYYVSQLAAIMIVVGDVAKAAEVLKHYFAGPFRDQIAASGEQPFEAVRTRPFHYRCFNLEAMITNAKLGDQLGLDFWTARSKYGASIQTAVDYAMTVDPKKEEIQELVPHVAAIAAAYGDPVGKYAAFMGKTMRNHEEKPFWFYDQVSAFKSAPTAKKTPMVRSSPRMWTRKNDVFAVNPAPKESQRAPREIPFECPDVFAEGQKVELEDGLFVTCGDLQPFYL